MQLRELDEQQLPSCDELIGLNGGEQCLRNRLQRRERRVVEAYEYALKMVDRPEVLKEAQDYWRAVRDDNCEVQTTDTEERIQCRIASTEERLGQLDGILNGDCINYGLSCAPPNKQDSSHR